MGFHHPGLVGKIKTKRTHHGRSQRHDTPGPLPPPLHTTPPCPGTAQQLNFTFLFGILPNSTDFHDSNCAAKLRSKRFICCLSCMRRVKGKSTSTFKTTTKSWTKQFEFTQGRDFRVHPVAAQWFFILLRRTLYPRKKGWAQDLSNGVLMVAMRLCFKELR